MRSKVDVHTVLSKLKKVRKVRPGQWIACCPAHDDPNPSLSIGLGTGGKVLLYCHAGCQFRDVMMALNSNLLQEGI